MVSYQQQEYVSRVSKKFCFDFSKGCPTLNPGQTHPVSWHRCANFIEYQREEMLCKTEVKPRLTLSDLKP